MARMTVKKALRLLDDTVYDGKEKHQVLKGLQILEKYYEDTDLSADHDQIWAGDEAEDLHIEKWSEEDVRRMAELGWHLDEDILRWSHFA